MISIRKTEIINSGKIVRKIEATGHADGEDHASICSAVSTLIQSATLYLARRHPYATDAQLDYGKSFVACEADVSDRAVLAVFDMMTEGLISLSKRYPDQVKIEE